MRKSAASAAAVLAAAAVVVGAGTASAGIWGTGYEGPWTAQAPCDSFSDAVNDPPYYYSYDCSYYASDPQGINRGAGWYYWFRQDIR